MIWLLAGLLVAGMAGIVAFVTLSRAVAQEAEPGETSPLVTVVVSTRAIEVRAPLSAEDVQVVEVPVDSVPEGALQEADDAIGKVTLVDLYPGEMLLSQRLVDPNVVSGDGRIALVMSEDEVLVAFPAGDLLTDVGAVKPGDHVDLLFSLDVPTERDGLETAGPAAEGEEQQAQDEQQTWTVLQNVTVASIERSEANEEGQLGTPRAILLTVSPQDALVLKYLKDADAVMDVALRAPGVESPFTTEPVDIDWIINKYQLPFEVGR